MSQYEDEDEEEVTIYGAIAKAIGTKTAKTAAELGLDPSNPKDCRTLAAGLLAVLVAFVSSPNDANPMVVREIATVIDENFPDIRLADSLKQ